MDPNEISEKFKPGEVSTNAGSTLQRTDAYPNVSNHRSFNFSAVGLTTDGTPFMIDCNRSCMFRNTAIEPISNPPNTSAAELSNDPFHSDIQIMTATIYTPNGPVQYTIQIEKDTLYTQLSSDGQPTKVMATVKEIRETRNIALTQTKHSGFGDNYRQHIRYFVKETGCPRGNRREYAEILVSAWHLSLGKAREGQALDSKARVQDPFPEEIISVLAQDSFRTTETKLSASPPV
jgi:hypothetical protein